MALRRFYFAALLLAWALPCNGQTRLAPFYALPQDGSWITYDWKLTVPEKPEERGLLRTASVGVKDVQGNRCRWIEIKVETKRADKTTWKVRKFLLNEKDFALGRSWSDTVLECYHRDDSNDSVKRIVGRRLFDFLSLGVPTEDMVLEEIQAKEEINTNLGRILGRHVAARSKDGQRIREYHHWLTSELPFGWARFEIREKLGDADTRVIFSALATKRGGGAKSEVDESLAK